MPASVSSILLTQPDTVITDIIVGNCYNNDTSPGSNKAEFSAGYWSPVQDKSYELKPFADRNPCYSQKAANSGEEAVGYHYSHRSFGAGTVRYLAFCQYPETVEKDM
ncbi:hypothetical protein JXO59_02960 [candidate division KSB1 bacterium]|nr:hypothetical protein [candidate division KSB1 bacterium]